MTAEAFKQRVVRAFRALSRRVDAVEADVPEDLATTIKELRDTVQRIDKSLERLVPLVVDLQRTVNETASDLRQFADVRGKQISEAHRVSSRLAPHVETLAAVALHAEGGDS